jgi:hypothetical protein
MEKIASEETINKVIVVINKEIYYLKAIEVNI